MTILSLIFSGTGCTGITCITGIMTHYVRTHYESLYVGFSITRITRVRIHYTSDISMTRIVGFSIPCITRITTPYVRAHHDALYVGFSMTRITCVMTHYLWDVQIEKASFLERDCKLC